MTYADSHARYDPALNTGGISAQLPNVTRVLIVTDNTDAIKGTVVELRALGFDVQLALFDGFKLASIPRECPEAVLCYFSDYIERSKSITEALKKHFAPRDIPIIGAASRLTKSDTSHFDSMMFAPMHSKQIANRVRSIIRLGQMEAEITRRIETLNENFDYQISLPDDLNRRKFQILFIGKATPAFMVIINALQQKNVNIIAAFTSFTAFDYLHEDRFDAVVMNALEHPEPALSISETMRRNSALYHIPALFLVDSDNFVHKDKAYESGASDIINADAPPEEISGRILELANYYRIHEQLKTEFNALGGPKCLDKSTLLFNSDFLAAHLPRIKSAASLSLKSYASIAISLRPDSVDKVKPIFMSSAFSQVGLMLKNLVRMQDIVARIDEHIFAIILPDVNEHNVKSVMERIKNVLDCAAFDTGTKDNAAFTMSVNIQSFEPRDYSKGDEIKEHILEELSNKPAKRLLA